MTVPGSAGRESRAGKLRSVGKRGPRFCFDTGARGEKEKGCCSTRTCTNSCVDTTFMQGTPKKQPSAFNVRMAGPTCASWEWRGADDSGRQPDLRGFLASTWCSKRERPASKNVLRDSSEENVGYRHRRSARRGVRALGAAAEPETGTEPDGARAQVQQAAFRPPAFVYGNDDEDNEDQDDDENWGWFETDEPELGQAYMPPIHQPPAVQASASWDSTRSDDFLYE